MTVGQALFQNSNSAISEWQYKHLPEVAFFNSSKILVGFMESKKIKFVDWFIC